MLHFPLHLIWRCFIPLVCAACLLREGQAAPEYPPLPKPPPNSSLIGVWQSKDPQTQRLTQLTFCRDGTYQELKDSSDEYLSEYGPEATAGTWSYDGKELSLQYHWSPDQPRREKIPATVVNLNVSNGGKSYQTVSLFLPDRKFLKTVAIPPLTFVATGTAEERRKAKREMDDMVTKLNETMNRYGLRNQPSPSASVASPVPAATPSVPASPATQSAELLPSPSPAPDSPLVGVWEWRPDGDQVWRRWTFCTDGTFQQWSPGNPEDSSGDEIKQGIWSYDGTQLVMQYRWDRKLQRETLPASVVDPAEGEGAPQLKIGDIVCVKADSQPPETFAISEAEQARQQATEDFFSIENASRLWGEAKSSAAKLEARATANKQPPAAATPAVAARAPSPVAAREVQFTNPNPTPEPATRAVPVVVTTGRSVSAAEVNGTWRYKDNELKILALGQGRLQLQFDLSAKFSKTYHTGFAAGEAAIENEVATFMPDRSGGCTVMLTFLRNGQLKVEEYGDCQFGGSGVFTDGTYRKVNAARPTFAPNP